MNIAVIIPTFNERDNLEKLIQEIFTLEIEDLEIIVVDDNSPDGTGKLAEKLKKENNKIHVIHRLGKLGLGTAYLEGFKFALDEGASAVFEIDADFSHNPKRIPDFLKEIKKADLVIGSRFIKWGKNDIGLLRRLTSRLGSIYARLILGMPISDCTGGFKCFRREVLENINFHEIHASNYAFQIEMNYRVFKKGFRIKEIPIIFKDREKGKSKFYFKMILESLWLVLKLRFSR
ncbi:MAG: polyprenol monophosphomannose synthase [Patescibacteria group bacterium]|nr:polyprenol monophosphomannose synthase [Patescibacteria group bacterium]